MLVGGIVIHDQVQGQFRGRLPVQVFEELQPLAVGVLRSGAGQHLARQVVQGGKERHGAVAVGPLRGRSCKVPSRSWAKRARVLPTALKCRPTWRAIWRLGTPRAASKITWARSVSCRLPLRAWARVSKRWRSSSFNSMTAA